MDHTLITKLEALLVKYSVNIIVTLLILIVGLLAAKLIKKLVVRALTKARIEKTLVKFVGNVVNGFLYIVIAIAVLNRLGVQTGSLIAVLGAIGLAVSLAFKDSLSNLAAGVLIIIHKPFRVDDFIAINGDCGTVTDINIFSTTLTTVNNEMLYIPNNLLTSDVITNYSQQSQRRLDIVIGIGYEDDTNKAKEIISKVLKNNSLTLKDPEPIIAVKALSDSSVDFTVRVWVAKENYVKLSLTLYEAIKIAFDENNINIPYPQRDVHITQKLVGNLSQ